MVRLGRYVLAPLAGLLLAGASYAQEMTDVGTPRNETLIVQTFDGKTANPNAMNPFNLYAIWRIPAPQVHTAPQAHRKQTSSVCFALFAINDDYGGIRGKSMPFFVEIASKRR
jgi:hypothetical protein